MSFPFPKSLFLEFLTYPEFRDFVSKCGLFADVLEKWQVPLYGANRNAILLSLQNNIDSVNIILASFLEKSPGYYGVVFAIQNMAVHRAIAGSEDKDLNTKRANHVANKVNFLLECLKLAKLPNFDKSFVLEKIDRGFKAQYSSFDFYSKVISKISDEQEATVNALYAYIRSASNKFLGPYKNHSLIKANKIMTSDNMLRDYFDRVVIINLDRRKDRWDAVQKKMAEINWPFKTPERFSAYDGEKLPVPVGWTSGAGTWGCLLSHREVLASTIQQGLDSVLVLEDDFFFAPDFENRVAEFLKNVPADWDQIMLGGQYLEESKAYDITTEVRKVSLCHRAHAYAVRGRFLRYMYSKLCASYGHVDHILNTFQDRYNVYAPKYFLIGQDGTPSDISGRTESPDLMRNPPDKDTPFFVLAPDVELHQAVVSSDLPLFYGPISESGMSAEIESLLRKAKHESVYHLHSIFISNIWYARSVYPSKYYVVLNPQGVLLEQIKEAKGNLNMVYVESLDQLKEAISKYPFGEELPTQFPEEDKQV